MNPRDFRHHHLEHLEHQRARMNAQFDKRRDRINAQFDRRRKRIKQMFGGRHEEIIMAAQQILNEEGINELSLRKLASKLNLKAPALYWYFHSKEELIDHLAEHILAQEFADLTPGTGDSTWQEWLIALCKRLRRAMLANRDGARIVAGAHLYPAVTLIKLFETATATLVAAGVTEEEADLVISTAVHFTFGRVIEEQSGPSPDQLGKFDFDDFAAQFPYLYKNVKRLRAERDHRAVQDDEFEASLRLIIR